MSTRLRLQKWIKTLNKKQMESIILELTLFGIEAEEVSFYESSKLPYWSNTGDNLDGTPLEGEDDSPF